MKLKLATIMLVGLASCGLAFAQAGPEAAPAGTQTTNGMATATTNAEPAVAAGTAAQTNAVPAETPTAAPVFQDATTAPSMEKHEEIIPLIQFQDVQLTTAIENLARQASINYILDPKVSFSQVDERGQVRPQPNISIRWENVSANQALNALLQNNGLELVEDNRTKIARITIKDPAAPEPLVTKIVQLKFSSPSNIMASVQTTLTDKRSKVIGDIRTSQLVVLATQKEQDAVDKLVVRLDTQTKQVLIEAKILETTLSPKTSKGIDWSGTLSAQRFSFGNNALPSLAPQAAIPASAGPPPTLAQPATQGTIGGILGDPKLLANTANGLNPGTMFLNADGVSATLSFLNSSSDTKVISEPRMVTLDNQKASIDVGLLFPIVNTAAGTANTSGGSSISYSNLTVSLGVTPRIAANNYIELKVQQGVLRLGPLFSSTVGGVINSVNSFLTRTLDTTVLIPSGNTLVMGGLISDEIGNSNTKVPLLGDIPGLGLLFRNDSKSLNRNNLIIFITPTVVQDTDFQPAHSEYLKSTGKEKVKENWSNWDSGKPYDWSKSQKD